MRMMREVTMSGMLGSTRKDSAIASVVMFLLLALCLLAPPAGADNTLRRNAEGNRLYQQKDYAGALGKYVEAQDGKRYSSQLSYNIANTLYQQREYWKAIKEYEKALSNDQSGLNQKIYFNRGNAFFQMGDFEQAAASYRKALENDAADREAKYNLELALEKLQQARAQDNQRKDQSKQEQQEKPQSKQGQNQANKQQDQTGKEKEPKGGPPASSAQQKPALDSQQAAQLLDAFNNQEKAEQRKQALRVQRQAASGKDW